MAFNQIVMFIGLACAFSVAGIVFSKLWYGPYELEEKAEEFGK